MKKNILFSRIYTCFRISESKVIFVLVQLLVLTLNFAFGQESLKISPTFRYLMEHPLTEENKDIYPSIYNIPQTEAYVASKGIYEKGYICVIYTKKPEALRTKGIEVQSVLPNFVTAWVTLAQITEMEQMSEVEYIEAPQVFYPNNDISVGTSGASLLHAGKLNNTIYKGDGVILAFYDTGIDWKHLDFRNPTNQAQSRILRIWDQTLTPIAGESSPSGFTYGVEYTQAHINNEIDGTPANYVRETDINGHGTHVAGTAAGNGAALSPTKYGGIAPNADIVVVKGGNGSFTTTNTVNALTYLQNLATSLNKPIVVNISAGGHASAHDGTREDEVAIDNFTNSAAGRVVVVSGGPDNGTLLHRQVSLAANGTTTITFNVPTPSTSTNLGILEFAAYANDTSAINVNLTSPTGNSLTANANTLVMQNSMINTILGSFKDAVSGDRSIILSLTRDTISYNPSGAWTLTLTNTTSNSLTIDGWLYYKGPDFLGTTIANADNNYLITSPGNATNAITVGSYVGKMEWINAIGTAYTVTQQDNISDFSSHGPRRDNVQKPNIVANGQKVVSCLSSNASPVSSDIVITGLYQVMQGTSMATAEVSGCVALMLQAKNTATFNDIRNAINSTATKDYFTTATANNTWGNGKIDVYKATSSLLFCKTLPRTTYSYDSSSTNANGSHVTFNGVKPGVRFSPTASGKLGGVYFKTGVNLTLSTFAIQVWSSSSNLPNTLLGSLTVSPSSVSKFAWNYYDMSSLNLSVTSGTDYFIVLSIGASDVLQLGIENLSPISGRSVYNSGSWVSYGSDLRIRSVVYDNTLPEINLQGNGNNIADGTTATSTTNFTDFGAINVGSNLAKTFTIQNTGTADLTISNIISSQPTVFVVSGAPISIAAGASATFTLTFSPTALATTNATITINNSDCDEAVYDFAVTGVGSCATPTFTACATNTSTSLTSGCSKVVSYTVTSPSTLTYTFTGATIASGSGNGSGQTFNLGTTNVVITATNGCGSTTTCSFSVTVIDGILPVVTVPANITENPAWASCSKSLAITNVNASDNCSISKLTWTSTGATILSSPATGINYVGTQTFNVGVTTITYTATDASNNVSTNSFTVTVIDNILPVITVPVNVTTTVAAGSCSKSLAISNASASDNCSISKLTWAAMGATTLSSPATGMNYVGTQTFNVGVTTITYTATDASNNVSTNSFTVTVTESILPVITVPANVTTTVAAGSCSKSLAITNASASDNCGVSKLTWATTGATVLSSPATGINYVGTQTFNVGVTTITYTATDASNNVSTNFFTVTITESILPVITVPANVTITVSAGGCSKSLAITNVSASDNCGVSKLTWGTTGATILSSPATGINYVGTQTFNVGVTTITYTATDASNNVSTNSFTVTVTDNILPAITVPANVATNVAAGSCSKSLAISNASVSDNCSVSKLTWAATGATVLSSPATGMNYVGTQTFNVGVTTITYTARDASNNVSTNSFTITVTENILPVITVPANVTTTVAAGSCSKSLAISNASASDNCGVSKLTWATTGATVLSSPATGMNYVGTQTFNVGATTITYTATDASNNVSTNFFIVIVTESILPVITVPANVTTTVATGSCSKGLAITNASASDNCSVSKLTWAATGATVLSSPTTGINYVGTQTFNVGVTTITYTATDASNNVSTNSFTVTVNDNIAPTAICNPLSVTLNNATGTYSLTSANLLALGNGSSDNCTVSTNLGFSASPNSFNCTTLGVRTVTLTVSDGNGNNATCNASVTVNNYIGANAGANATICNNTSTTLSGVGTGASGTYTYLWSPNTNLSNPNINNPVANPSSNQTYTLTVSDVFGCSATSSVLVSVNTIPTATAIGSTVCQNTTASLSANGGITYAWTGPNGFTSNLQNPTIPNMTTSNAGTYTVVVSNASGCSASATANVVVNTILTATAIGSTVCQNTTASLTASGGTTYSWTGPNGFTSNLQNPIILNAATSNAGTYTVVVGNTSGCSASATANVIVNAPPIATASGSTVCVNAAASLTASGGTTYSWTGPSGFTSNLQNPTIPNTTTLNAGTYTVVVSNASGCSASATANVVVNVLPTASASGSTVCQNSTASLSANGGITYAWTGPNGFTSSLQNPVIVNAMPVNAGTYTVVVSNVSGCSTSATANIIVNAPPIAIASGSTVCPNTTASLSASGGANYAWAGPSGFSSNLQNPTILNATTSNAGTYTVVVGNTSGCSASATANVIVNAPPIAIASGSTVCTNAIASLNASGGTNYVWTGPSGFISNLQNPTIPNTTTLNAGTYTVVVSNASGCSASATANVVVNTIPIATANGSIVCQNSTASLNASGGITYEWTGPSGFTSNLQNPTINNAMASNAGTYTVIVSNVSGCSASATANVGINQSNNIVSINPTVNCSQLSLTANVAGCIASAGNMTYLWSFGNGQTSTSPNPTVNYTALGTYPVTLTVTGNGASVTNSTNVNINSLNTAAILPTINCDKVFFSPNISGCILSSGSSTNTGNVVYYWDFGNGLSSNVPYPTVTYAESGTYTVTLTATGNGSSVTQSIFISVVKCN